jgi:hypothetical protein
MFFTHPACPVKNKIHIHVLFPPFPSQMFQNMKLFLINRKTIKLEKFFNIFVHAVEDARGRRRHGGFGGGPRSRAIFKQEGGCREVR